MMSGEKNMNSTELMETVLGLIRELGRAEVIAEDLSASARKRGDYAEEERWAKIAIDTGLVRDQAVRKGLSESVKLEK
jgi:hypothetical protein